MDAVSEFVEPNLTDDRLSLYIRSAVKKDSWLSDANGKGAEVSLVLPEKLSGETPICPAHLR